MTLEELERVIAARALASTEDSWTAKLLAKGPEKVAEKFGEEAIECLIEAVRGDREKLTSEAADVLFHLLVMLRSRDISVADVMTELEARQTQSGLAEKATRNAKS
ncbi:MAG: phosphoribosyl-ATP diphosphatase [Pseudomonadota bacterium]